LRSEQGFDESLKCSLIVNWRFFGFQLQQLGYAATHPVLAASDLYKSSFLIGRCVVEEDAKLFSRDMRMIKMAADFSIS
jgi:hypothetical protein